MSSAPGGEKRVVINKYPNRRYYNVTHSCHVTLEDILRLVRDGSDIEVRDSKSGEDITAKVLTQIILDHDPVKLAVFPSELLHQIIRTGEPLVRDFVEKYFTQAFLAFSRSQEQFTQYLRETLGLQMPMGMPAWPPFLMPPYASMNPYPPGPSAGGPSPEELTRQMAELQKQVLALQQQSESG